MSGELKDYILRHGLILGCITSCVYLLIYISGDSEDFLNSKLNWINSIICLVYPIYYTSIYKSFNKGYISFKSAFSCFTGILITYCFIRSAFHVLLFHVVDSEFGSKILDIQLNMILPSIDESSISEDQGEKMLEMMEYVLSYSPSSVFFRFALSTIKYALGGLIIGLIFKNKRPFINE